MKTAGEQLPRLSTSDDFNSRLLNRIARERFAETRTKAYLPRRAPLIGWRRLAPVVTVVTVLALVFGYSFMPAFESGSNGVAQSGPADDDLYLTVQPTDNPNMTASLRADWSLDKHLEWRDRVARLSHSVTGRSGFGNLHLTSGFDSRTVTVSNRVPYARSYYRVQPIVRVYQSSSKSSPEEDEKIY